MNGDIMPFTPLPTCIYLSKKVSYQFLYLVIALISVCCSNKKDTGDAIVNELKMETSETKATDNKKVIVFFGNSLTAGYGVDPSESYPSLIQNKIDSAGLPYIVINSGVSGETSATGKNRIAWVLKQHVDVFVLELGANDGLRGLPIEATRSNLHAIIDSVQIKYPEAEVLLAGMQIPPNMGKDYAGKFEKMFIEISLKQNIKLIPFLLKGVGGEPDFNLDDGIHPNPKGYKIVAENVWSVLKSAL